MKVLHINVEKIEKAELFKGKKGTYMDLLLFENREGKDEYGNDGFVVQSISKERKDAGEKGPIVGNWKEVDTRPNAAPRQDVAPEDLTTRNVHPDQGTEQDDIPF
jgi:hypothetical protein